MGTDTGTVSGWRGIWRFLEMSKVSLKNEEKMVFGS